MKLRVYFVTVHYANGATMNLAGFKCVNALAALRYVGAGFSGVELGNYSFLSVESL
jgi:hypothetical protein